MKPKSKPKLERVLTKEALAWLNDLPQSHFFKVHGGPYQSTGISDLIGVFRGQFVAIELKVGYNTATPRQKWFLGKITEAKGAATVCRSLDEVKQVMRALIEAEHLAHVDFIKNAYTGD